MEYKSCHVMGVHFKTVDVSCDGVHVKTVDYENIRESVVLVILVIVVPC